MSGSIEHLGKDRYRLAVYVGYDATTGKRKYRRRTHRGTARSARKALAELVLEVENSTPDPSRGYTMNQVFDMYISTRRHTWAPSTARNTPATIDRYLRPQFGHIRADQLTVWEVQQFVSDLADTKPPTARAALNALRAALTEAQRHELVVRNVASLVQAPPQPRANTHAPDPAKVRALIAQADQAMAMVVRIAMVTGCRRGEILGLQWGDFDWDAAEVVVSRSITSGGGELIVKSTKTGRIKVLALDDETLKALRSWRTTCIEAFLKLGKQLAPDTFLFPQWPEVHLPWWPDTVSTKWRELADKHDLEGIRFHDLRHAAATTLLSAGVSPRDAAERLGHDPAVLLRTYAHAVRAADQESAEILARALDGK